MGGGGGGDTTTTQEPWAGQKPYLQDLMRQAQSQYLGGVGQQYFPGQTVAEFSPQTQAGLAQMTQQGMQGSPLRNPMQQYLGSALMNPAGMAGVGMGMPGQNPYLDQMVGTVGQRMGEQFQDVTAPAIAAQFGGAGRTGGGIHQEVMADAADQALQSFGQQAADIYGRDYSDAMARDIQRRQLMGDIGTRAAALAPQAQQMQMTDIDQLMRAGALTEDQAQRLIQAEMDRFNFQQQAPIQALQNYAGIVQGVPSFTNQQTQGPQGSRVAGALGGAMAGAGLGGSVAALNPYTMPLAIGGGLLGMF